ncbi:dihydrodipicolinate synthase family protein [Candidatus Halobonum tyrrellensis]|nr:dihydrodipicolinate synthase family protein [Candidatus Halobonum tyrrellensis]
MNEDALRRRFRDVAFTTAVPFTDDAADVRYDALAENVADLYDAGARLFVPCGNTGEYYALSEAERKRVVRTHVEATGDDATVAGGAGGSLATVRSLTDAYEDAGADAVMVMHPDHTYVHEEGLREYYRAVCESTDLGVVIYKRGPELTREVLADLSERESVVAVKFAVNDVKEFAATVADAPGEVTWVNGLAERFALSYAVEGAAGYTTGVGNFAPEATLALFEAVDAGEWERARRLQRAIRPFEDLREETGEGNSLAAANNVPAVKEGMRLAGYRAGPVRPPLTGLSEADADRAADYYDRIVDAQPLTAD